MVTLDPAILSQVAKPVRYTGAELNSISKDHARVDVTFALAFPDVYEVGMSYLGYKILYHILNKRQDTAAERVYAPWVDMEQQMRTHRLPLYSLETFTPVAEFDLVGFTLQYELSYSNIVNMIDLSGISLLAAERGPDEPFIVGGGPCVYNPEPLADFFDFFIIGDGEEAIGEVSGCMAAWKKAGRPGGRQGFLTAVAQLAGIYVPSFYAVAYNNDGTIKSVVPKVEVARPMVCKRFVQDMDAVDYPTSPVVPFGDIVHNRIMLELFRGCSRGCRFCQAGMVYRPVRERKLATLLQQAEELVTNTGYDEISLVSLSSADYSHLHGLVQGLMGRFADRQVSVSLPSLRIDSFSIQLAKDVQQVRRSGLTFAPEAGTQRMRDVINKGVTEQDLEEAVSAAFAAGWSGVKLYFMLGLPTETDEDLQGIADLAHKVLALYRQIKGRGGAKVTVSVSSFVPKGNTPFQWFAQDTVAEIERKQDYLKELLRHSRNISLNWHDAETSFLEGVFARGDRRLSQVILRAWKKGVRFDGWSEQFKYPQWQEAFAESGIDPHFYANRQRELEEHFPWEHISPGIAKQFLWQEWEKALAGTTTADCRHGVCGGCGVCGSLDVSIVDWGQEQGEDKA